MANISASRNGLYTRSSNTPESDEGPWPSMTPAVRAMMGVRRPFSASLILMAASFPSIPGILRSIQIK